MGRLEGCRVVRSRLLRPRPHGAHENAGPLLIVYSWYVVPIPGTADPSAHARSRSRPEPDPLRAVFRRILFSYMVERCVAKCTCTQHTSGRRTARARSHMRKHTWCTKGARSMAPVGGALQRAESADENARTYDRNRRRRLAPKARLGCALPARCSPPPPSARHRTRQPHACSLADSLVCPPASRPLARSRPQVMYREGRIHLI